MSVSDRRIPMRIGMLTTSFPRDDRDIAGIFVLGFARALANTGHIIDVLAPEPREKTPTPRWPAIQVEHVPYLRPRTLERTFYGDGVPDNLARDPLAWLGLGPFACALLHRAYQRAHRWDALISHWALPCALAAGCVRRGRPHIAVFHSADVHALTRLPLRTQLASLIVRSASALWFVSDHQRQTFLELLPRGHAEPRTVVSPMGVELPASGGFEREQLRRRHGLQRFSVLCLGRLVPIKGVDTAIRAVAARNMTLIVAGEGPERGRLAQLAAQLHADVRFMGMVTGEAKIALLQSVDAFVLPSRPLPNGRSEGLPTALLEAMAYGLPVAASRLPGIEALLSAAALGSGLVPADDPHALGSALDALTESNAERRAQGARCRAAAQQFAWSQVAERAQTLLA